MMLLYIDVTIYVGLGDVPEELVCSTPGCKRPKYKNPKGAYFDYCSMKCRDGRRLSLPGTLYN